MNHSRNHIFLIGFSGSGKSTVGPILAEKLRRKFIDTDAVIAKRAGRSIAAIFARDGEAAFRRLECDTIKETAEKKSGQVIAVGGGAVLNETNRRTMQSFGLIIYLGCAIPEIRRRLADVNDRPLLGRTTSARLVRIRQMLSERKPVYQSVADVTIMTTNLTPDEVVSEIIRRLGLR